MVSAFPTTTDPGGKAEGMASSSMMSGSWGLRAPFALRGWWGAIEIVRSQARRPW